MDIPNKIEVAVYMPDDEVKKFLVFQQYYSAFSVLKDSGVFRIQYGKAVLNFMEGELRTITKEEVIYKK